MSHAFPLLRIAIAGAVLSGCERTPVSVDARPPTPGSTASALTAAATPDAAIASSAVPDDDRCPTAVPQAVTSVADIDGGVEVRITASDPAATRRIRERVQPPAMFDCQSAKDPHGWMTDDCFGGATPCPIMARRTDAELIDVDGGVRITMRPLPTLMTVDALRREVRARAVRRGVVR